MYGHFQSWTVDIAINYLSRNCIRRNVYTFFGGSLCVCVDRQTGRQIDNQLKMVGTTHVL
jgi:hypothetical protein